MIFLVAVADSSASLNASWGVDRSGACVTGECPARSAVPVSTKPVVAFVRVTSVDGALRAASVAVAVQTARFDLATCVAGANGKAAITARLVVDRSGGVESVVVDPGATPSKAPLNAALKSCLRGVLARLVFDSSTKSTRVAIVIPSA